MANKQALKPKKPLVPVDHGSLANSSASAPPVGENANDYTFDDSDVDETSPSTKEAPLHHLARRAVFTREAVGWQRFWATYALRFTSLTTLRVRMPHCFDKIGSWRLAKLLNQNNGWKMLTYTDERQHLQTAEDLVRYIQGTPRDSFEHARESKVWPAGRFVRRSWVWPESQSRFRTIEGKNIRNWALDATLTSEWADRKFTAEDFTDTQSHEDEEFTKATNRSAAAAQREQEAELSGDPSGTIPEQERRRRKQLYHHGLRQASQRRWETQLQAAIDDLKRKLDQVKETEKQYTRDSDEAQNLRDARMQLRARIQWLQHRQSEESPVFGAPEDDVLEDTGSIFRETKFKSYKRVVADPLGTFPASWFEGIRGPSEGQTWQEYFGSLRSTSGYVDEGQDLGRRSTLDIPTGSQDSRPDDEPHRLDIDPILVDKPGQNLRDTREASGTTVFTTKVPSNSRKRGRNDDDEATSTATVKKARTDNLPTIGDGEAQGTKPKTTISATMAKSAKRGRTKDDETEQGVAKKAKTGNLSTADEIEVEITETVVTETVTASTTATALPQQDASQATRPLAIQMSNEPETQEQPIEEAVPQKSHTPRQTSKSKSRLKTGSTKGPAPKSATGDTTTSGTKEVIDLTEPEPQATTTKPTPSEKPLTTKDTDKDEVTPTDQSEQHEPPPGPTTTTTKPTSSQKPASKEAPSKQNATTPAPSEPAPSPEIAPEPSSTPTKPPPPEKPATKKPKRGTTKAPKHVEVEPSPAPSPTPSPDTESDDDDENAKRTRGNKRGSAGTYIPPSHEPDDDDDDDEPKPKRGRGRLKGSGKGTATRTATTGARGTRGKKKADGEMAAEPESPVARRTRARTKKKAGGGN